MNSTALPLLTVPLGLETHSRARSLAAQQSTVEKGKRVYLNALAVYAVHSYLKWLQIQTDLQNSDSWNLVKATLSDVADLVITGIGKLECRPVLPGESVIPLPDGIENRIGYVAVQFHERLDSVQLLGFASASDGSNPLQQLLVVELEPIDALLDLLTRLEEAIAFLQTSDPVAVQVRSIRQTQSLSEIVAKLEYIYRTCDELEWRYAGSEALAGSPTTAGNTRETINEDSSELQDLAEMLLEKLAEIWQNAA